MSAAILHWPLLRLTTATVRLARHQRMVAEDTTDFTDWLLERVAEGKISYEMAQAICRYQELSA